jgi:hypothetical protein
VGPLEVLGDELAVLGHPVDVGSRLLVAELDGDCEAAKRFAMVLVDAETGI